MKKFVILDTETTGFQESPETNYVLDAYNPMFRVIGEQENRILQLAYIAGDLNNNEISCEVVVDELCKPPVPQTVGSIATTGIVPEMLVDKPTFNELNGVSVLNDLNVEENILVIHNAQFDIEMLRREGFDNKMKLIDTLRVIRHLFPDDESHSMQWYRYGRKLYLKEPEAIKKVGKEIAAHDALGDVIVLKLLLEDLLQKGVTVEQMIELTQKPIFIKRMNFGKHRGKQIEDVAKNDPRYLLYLLSEEMKKDIDKRNSDLVFTINKLIEDLNLLSEYKFSFGKYKGMEVAHVIQNDMSYINWIMSDLKDGKNTDPILIMAIESLLPEK